MAQETEMSERIHRDCFAYDKRKHRCDALNETECKNCHFYKTREEYEKGVRAHGGYARS